MQSILNNLNILFNTSKGSLVYDPEYGLPDLSLVYQKLKQSQQNFISEIEQTILKYEPRAKQVQVKADQNKVLNCILCLHVTLVLLNNSTYQFQSNFMINKNVILKDFYA